MGGAIELGNWTPATEFNMRLPLQSAGAKNPVSLMFRFHTQTAGVQLTAQKPEVNVVRVAVRGLAAVPGGSQSLHTNFYGEANALHTEKGARVALRTQKVLAFETDVTATVDPFAGSYVIESMTDEVEAKAINLLNKLKRASLRQLQLNKVFKKWKSKTPRARSPHSTSGWS
jgi:methylmalonyl-CoA mutase N-terminal domain/subunit